MITEAVILAGGFGTRLSHVLGNVPKPMAPVAGKPFLTYVLDRLNDAGVKRGILATGYMHEVVNHYFGNRYRDIEIVYSHETQPLLTGGAILQATQYVRGEHFLVLNGDTLFDIDFEALSNHHLSHSASITIALREVDDTSRYGAVETKGTQIISFREKVNSCGAGSINGGIYAINKRWLNHACANMPQKFSFEKDILQTHDGFEGLTFTNYFIDIGVPTDYYRAQKEFMSLFKPDEFLFLDRDGVINKYIENGYVCSWDEFEWMPDVKPTLALLSQRYRRICVVTNQQGVGKGCFTQDTLDDIHNRMVSEIREAGGRIDRIYCCTALAAENSPYRKPNIGMLLQAQSEYPEIDFTRSVMVGDALTDMQMGYRAGMRCVYITRNNPLPDEVKDYTDCYYVDLQEAARSILR